MNQFAQTRDWLAVATMSLEMANSALFKPYDSGELNSFAKVDDRLEELRKQIWTLRNEMVNVREALYADELEGLDAGAREELYKMGLMSPEEEADYIFGPKNEMPF
jgi:hypothetical protein